MVRAFLMPVFWAAVRSITQFIAGQAFNIGQNALIVAALFGLMLYVLFFFFGDGTRIIDAIVRAIPMGDDRERRLMARFAEVTRATVKGTLIVAAVQGTLGGILFALVGIQAALFWGVTMGVLSLLPAVGPALVWGPAALVLAAKGELWEGAVVVIAGTLVIGLVDNLLRPILIGRESKMPDYLILLATLGGLSARPAVCSAPARLTTSSVRCANSRVHAASSRYLPRNDFRAGVP